MELQETDWKDMEWINLIQNRDQQWASVSNLMELRVVPQCAFKELID